MLVGKRKAGAKPAFVKTKRKKQTMKKESYCKHPQNRCSGGDFSLV
jgi:hypothetical protein